MDSRLFYQWLDDLKHLNLLAGKSKETFELKYYQLFHARHETRLMLQQFLLGYLSGQGVLMYSILRIQSLPIHQKRICEEFEVFLSKLSSFSI